VVVLGNWLTRWAVALLWLAWLVYWGIAARGTKETARHESIGSRMSYVLPTLVAGWLLASAAPHWPALSERFVPRTPVIFWIGVAVLAAGLAFAVWARRHLGSNWSGTVTLKRDHSLVRTGPYGWVRHPIYTGLLLAFIGTAITMGTWRALLATAILAASLIRKLHIEEQWMRELFKDEYVRYAAQVPALIPLVY